MSHLIPTPIVDKNGVATTRNKKADATPTERTLNAPTPSPSASTSVSTGGKVDRSIPEVGEERTMETYNVELSEVYEDSEYDEELQETIYHFSDAYDDVEDRAAYLSAEDGVVGVAKNIGVRHEDDLGMNLGTNYDVTLSTYDGNKGYPRFVTVPFSTGSAHTETPTVQDVVSTLVMDAQTAEQFPTMGDVHDFASEMGMEINDEEELEEAKKTLGQIHEIANKLKSLVGEVRYGDYVHGRYKADYGYDGGITYAKEQ